MKKLFPFLSIICMCFSLSACTATDPDNLFGSVPEDKKNTFPEDFVYYQGVYQYGNRQQGADFVLYGNDVVYAHTYVDKKYGYPHADSFYCYDLIQNEILPFCKDATCTHGTCVGGTLWYNLEVYKGTLYGLNKEWQVVEVTEEDLKTVVDGKVTDFLHYDDKLYAKTWDSSLVVFEEGKKEPQVLVDEYTGNDAVIFDNYLYTNSNFTNFIRINLTDAEPNEEVIVSNARGITDGQYIYYLDLKTEYLYRCNMDGSNSQQITEKPVYDASMNFDDEYCYFRYVKDMAYDYPQGSGVEEGNKYMDEWLTGYPDCYDLYRFPKEDPTKIEKIATLPHPIHSVYTVPGTGKLFIWSYAPVGEERPFYILGTDGSNPTMLEIPEY